MGTTLGRTYHLHRVLTKASHGEAKGKRELYYAVTTYHRPLVTRSTDLVKQNSAPVGRPQCYLYVSPAVFKACFLTIDRDVLQEILPLVLGQDMHQVYLTCLPLWCTMPNHMCRSSSPRLSTDIQNAQPNLGPGLLPLSSPLLQCWACPTPPPSPPSLWGRARPGLCINFYMSASNNFGSPTPASSNFSYD